VRSALLGTVPGFEMGPDATLAMRSGIARSMKMEKTESKIARWWAPLRGDGGKRPPVMAAASTKMDVM
jgi:hypothetical protein